MFHFDYLLYKIKDFVQSNEDSFLLLLNESFVYFP